MQVKDCHFVKVTYHTVHISKSWPWKPIVFCKVMQISNLRVTIRVMF